MNTKTKYHIIILVLAALVLPLSWANAAASLQFTQASIPGAPGQDVTISLQVVSDAAGIRAVDYWLTQVVLPGNINASSTFTIVPITTSPFVGTTRTTSDFPNPSADDATVTSSGDSFNNHTGAPTSDGIPDNLFGDINSLTDKTNGPDLGATKNGAANFPAGTFNLGSFKIHINSNALPGTYTIQTFDYQGFGWSNVAGADNPFASQGSINIVISAVPEPATWSLLGLGGLGAFGLNLLRARRLVS